MRAQTIPALKELVDSCVVENYPYSKSFEDARHDECLVLHTAGSTGLPKPIVWKNGMLSTYEEWHLATSVNGYMPTTEIYQQATSAYTSMPLFHTSDINAAMGRVDELSLPSAPLPHKAGNIITKYSRVIGNLGATETANLLRLVLAPEDWEYFYWHFTHSGIELRPDPDSDSGLHEPFIVCGGADLEPFQVGFYAFPDVNEGSMNDLYDRHPTKPFLWRYRGRKDDVIVLSNGEKITPPLIETVLASCPYVRGAMVAEQRRFQPMTLIELQEGVAPPTTTHEREDILEILGPFIEAANRHAPAHAQLDRHHILFADPHRPIQYLGQGKIQRRRMYQVYEEDIATAHSTAEDAVATKTTPPELESGSHAETVVWLRRFLAEISLVAPRAVGRFLPRGPRLAAGGEAHARDPGGFGNGYIPASHTRLASRLINSSVHLGCFPKSFPSRDHIDWLPVDKAARVSIEILESASSSIANLGNDTLPVFHVANPYAISWSKIVPWVANVLRLRPVSRPVSFEEWLSKLKSCRAPLEDIDKNPAIKPVDFYRTAGRAHAPRRMMTWRAAQVSKTLREVGPVNGQWVDMWLNQMGYDLKSGNGYMCCHGMRVIVVQNLEHIITPSGRTHIVSHIASSPANKCDPMTLHGP
ncbi:hypothetical protein F5B22DRAFT_660436 [Xylaria bambusicola]|uniref:uncharacterized protein n=1 Tax=Xylaria bambusicola TaxID=326684 RepID=UPI0020084B9F|nr:uncharacterized protein F5B22DRAFT_660436 [Xylaria bambusicola]KAI0522070.1 hypothetical protein F5B22DRAFT_660436 [Xylaria bambusicola]